MTQPPEGSSRLFGGNGSQGWAGPFLYMRGLREGGVDLAVLMAVPTSDATPELRTPEGAVPGRTIRECEGLRLLRYGFSLDRSRQAWYTVDGVRYEVDTVFDGDLRLAYVSCNGQEEGDRKRPLEERNVLWQRLGEQHRARPFQLLLQGGDQIYADEVLNTHPLLRRWAKGDRRALESQPSDSLGEVAETLRRSFFLLYLEILSQPETAWMMARVPTLAMWDDHDICDGWGSMREAKLDSPVGRCLFDAAREHFLLFQLGADPNELPEFCLDPSGVSLGWHVELPQLHVIAPDLRSERRPNRVMGERGWQALTKALNAVKNGRVLLLSSVPALGPRLSWIEALMGLTRRMEKYEDDLRDQWQSRSHRGEWRRFLESLAEVHRNPETPVTLLSGEIHLATRGTFEVPPAAMHQLVASGITHPAPPGTYARALGALARLGESPLPGHPIRLHPLPGKQAVYTAQRNYLILEMQQGEWQAWWELEEGPTPALKI